MKNVKKIIISLVVLTLIIIGDIFLFPWLSSKLLHPYENKSEVLFKAGAPSTFGDAYWLTLYKDNGFLLELPTDRYKGTYYVRDNIIYLNYKPRIKNEEYAEGFIINLNNGKIESVDINHKPYTTTDGKHWMYIDLNNL